MTVEELREWLKPVPGNWQVLLANDSVGDNFSSLAEPGTLICRIINPLEIECVNLDERHYLPTGTETLVLWPR